MHLCITALNPDYWTPTYKIYMYVHSIVYKLVQILNTYIEKYTIRNIRFVKVAMF